MPHTSPAYQQHEQETLEALDRLLLAGHNYRAAVAAHQPSVAIAQQMAADMTRVVAQTGLMAGMATAARLAQESVPRTTAA